MFLGLLGRASAASPSVSDALAVPPFLSRCSAVLGSDVPSGVLGSAVCERALANDVDASGGALMLRGLLGCYDAAVSQWSDARHGFCITDEDADSAWLVRGLHGDHSALDTETSQNRDCNRALSRQRTAADLERDQCAGLPSGEGVLRNGVQLPVPYQLRHFANASFASVDDFTFYERLGDGVDGTVWRATFANQGASGQLDEYEYAVKLTVKDPSLLARTGQLAQRMLADEAFAMILAHRDAPHGRHDGLVTLSHVLLDSTQRIVGIAMPLLRTTKPPSCPGKTLYDVRQFIHDTVHEVILDGDACCSPEAADALGLLSLVPAAILDIVTATRRLHAASLAHTDLHPEQMLVSFEPARSGVESGGGATWFAAHRLRATLIDLSRLTAYGNIMYDATCSHECWRRRTKRLTWVHPSRFAATQEAGPWVDTFGLGDMIRTYLDLHWTLYDALAAPQGDEAQDTCADDRWVPTETCEAFWNARVPASVLVLRPPADGYDLVAWLTPTEVYPPAFESVVPDVTRFLRAWKVLHY